MEMNFQIERSSFTSEEAERMWFRDLLWQAFPKCASDNERAETAAKVLSRKNRTVTPRTVKNWLNCENTPHFRYVLTIMAIAAAERVARAVSP